MSEDEEEESSVADARTMFPIIALIGGLLIALGSFLPWVEAHAGLFSISKSGIDGGGDGVFTLIIGIVTVMIGIARLTGRSLPRFLQRSSVVTGLAAGGIAIANWVDLSSRVQTASTVSNGIVNAVIGAGLWTILIGAVLAFFGGLGLRRNEVSAASWDLGSGLMGLSFVLLIAAIAAFVHYQQHQQAVAQAQAQQNAEAAASQSEQSAADAFQQQMAANAAQQANDSGDDAGGNVGSHPDIYAVHFDKCQGNGFGSSTIYGSLKNTGDKVRSFTITAQFTTDQQGATRLGTAEAFINHLAPGQTENWSAFGVPNADHYYCGIYEVQWNSF
ncbi:MAG: hypothetical protein ACYDCC_15255 [Actinomycetota bacterium]